MDGSEEAVTLIAIVVVPVPPPWLSTPAAYIVVAVVVVTVGAIQLKVHDFVLLGVDWTSSPLRIFVPVPATNVPAALDATSTPPLVPGPFMVTV